MVTNINPQPVPFDKLSDAPADAFILDARLSQPDSQDEVELTKVSLTARTSDPLYHWWWGNIVHDMDGFFKHKESVNLDWNHDPNNLVGYADKQVASHENGLQLEGKLISLEPKDQADKIRLWRKSGMPLEASIYFDEAEMEYIPQDMTTQVNGKQFDGPGVVVRKWTIRGCAICPYGYDGKTETRLSKQQFKFSIRKGVDMSATAEATKTEEVKAEETPKAEELSKSDNNGVTTVETKVDENKLSAEDFRKELNKFTTAFGSENGVKWFNEGVTFSDAQGKHIDMLSKANADLKTENEKIKAELTSFRKTLGEEKGLETVPSDGKKFARNMTEAREAAKK